MMNKLPQTTQDRIKADAKKYMHVEIKGMVGEEELQPHHLEYAYIAGATAEVERAQAEEALRFAEWLRNEGWHGVKHVGWINHSHALENLRFYTTKQLWEVFKKTTKEAW